MHAVFFLIVLCASEIKSNCSLERQNDELKWIETVSKAITLSFVQKNYIQFLSNGCYLSHLVETALANLGIAVTVKPYSPNYSKNEDPSDGTIIATNHLESLKGIIKEGHFRPHKRLLIFYNWRDNFFGSPFTEAVQIRGLDILIIQGFNFDLITEMYCEPTKSNFEVFYLKRNDTKNIIDEEYFAYEEWKPTTGPFVGAAFNCSPFVIDGPKLDGLEYRIIREIAQINGWSLEMKMLDNLENVSLYVEVLNALRRKEAHVGLCSQWITVVPIDQFDVTYPYTQLCITFLAPKPKLLPDETLILQPLNSTVWVTLLILLCFMIFFMLYLIWLYPSDKKDYVVGILDVLRITTQNSLPRFPCSGWNAARILLTAWCLNSLLINTGYSAGYTSSITTPKITKPIDTLAEMVDANILWGGPDYSNKLTLLGHPNKHVQRLLNNYQLESSITQRNNRIRHLNYAVYVKILPRKYITDTETLDNFGKSHMRVLKECALEGYIVFSLMKNSPYTGIIAAYIMKFIEHGLINYWDTVIRIVSELNYMSNFYSSYATKIGKKNPLTLIEIQGAFIILATGLVMSTLALLLEVFIARK